MIFFGLKDPIAKQSFTWELSQGQDLLQGRGNQVVLLYAFESQSCCCDVLHGIAADPETADGGT